MQNKSRLWSFLSVIYLVLTNILFINICVLLSKASSCPEPCSDGLGGYVFAARIMCVQFSMRNTVAFESKYELTQLIFSSLEKRERKLTQSSVY